jgi:hypothetical protein
MKSSRKLISVIALLCLFGAQQAAFAHWAAHLGAPPAVGLESTDGEHAAAAVLGQSCKSCAAFSALDAALTHGRPAAAAAVPADPVPPAPQEKSAATTRRYDSRAPPAVL